MAGVTSNLDEVETLLDDLANAIDFTRPGRERAIGREMADVVIDGISDRTIQEQASPDGTAFAALSPRYLARKTAQGFPALIGVRTGQMLSRVEMAGDVTIEPQSIVISYGATEEAKLKLLWFSIGCGVDTLGRNQNRPPRPLWGLDGRIVVDLNAYVVERVANHIARLGAGGGT